MRDSEKREFCEIVGAILQTHGRPANTAVLQVWWGALKAWPLNQVRRALDMFVREGGNPVPATIVALLPDPLGHPGAEEAWNAAQKDEETEGAFMSEQMLIAVCAAFDSLERGDMIGARRCFIDVYEEQVRQARIAGTRPKFRYFAPTGLRPQGPGDRRWVERNQIEAAATRDAMTRGWVPENHGQARLKELGAEAKPMAKRVRDELKRLPGS